MMRKIKPQTTCTTRYCTSTQCMSMQFSDRIDEKTLLSTTGVPWLIIKGEHSTPQYTSHCNKLKGLSINSDILYQVNSVCFTANHFSCSQKLRNTQHSKPSTYLVSVFHWNRLGGGRNLFGLLSSPDCAQPHKVVDKI